MSRGHKHITIDDLPPKYREQAERQIKYTAKAYAQKAIEEAGSSHWMQDAKKIANTPAPARTRERKPSAPNKTEQLFNREVLGGDGMYEAIRFRLMGGSFYCPDYLAFTFDPLTNQYDTHVYEVKGTYRLGSHGRALTAFREARAAFPFLKFHWYERQKGGGWLERYKQ